MHYFTTLDFFLSFTWLDAVDILLVAILFFQLYRLARGTVALNILIGVGVFYIFYRVVVLLHLELFSSILGKFIDAGVIALLIVFQPELRRFFLFIGSSNFVGNNRLRKAFLSWGSGDGKKSTTDINAIVRACRNMAETKTGAIIVIARQNDLNFYANTGDAVEAAVSVRMLESIFFKNSPLHDGAVLISGNIIRAARCVLPVTEEADFPARLGMRHRAAVGVTENSDAVAIVVSEQTGEISFAKEGEIEVGITPEKLRELLTRESK